MIADDLIWDACAKVIKETKRALSLNSVAVACECTPEEVSAALIRASKGRVVGFNLPATHITYIMGQSAE